MTDCPLFLRRLVTSSVSPCFIHVSNILSTAILGLTCFSSLVWWLYVDRSTLPFDDERWEFLDTKRFDDSVFSKWYSWVKNTKDFQKEKRLEAHILEW